MSENLFLFRPSHLNQRHGISSLPSGQCSVIACLSTSLGDLNAFRHPFHSQRKGFAGSGLGIVTGDTVVTAVDPTVVGVEGTVAAFDADISLYMKVTIFFRFFGFKVRNK